MTQVLSTNIKNPLDLVFRQTPAYYSFSNVQSEQRPRPHYGINVPPVLALTSVNPESFVDALPLFVVVPVSFVVDSALLDSQNSEHLKFLVTMQEQAMEQEELVSQLSY